MDEAGSARWRPLALAVTVALLGATLIVGSFAESRESRWVVDPLRYSTVRLNRGHRSPPSIHLAGSDGRTYYLPRRLWKGRMEEEELVRRLRADSVVTVEVVGGEGALHGYPEVERLVMRQDTLAVPPSGTAARTARLLAGPLLLLAGGWGVARARGRA